VTGPARRVLVEALWRARSEGTTVRLDEAAWAGLDRDLAEAVAGDLYGRVLPDPPAAWKLGALDIPTQERLGLAGPLVAPVLPDRLHQGAREVRLNLAGFAQPRLEAELGVQVDGSGAPRPLPCVEVADSRLPGWRLPPAAAIADFGLQGAMVFGEAAPAAGDVVRVEVRHDGRIVETGEQSWADTLARLSLLPEAARRRPFVVATGAITPLRDAAPGRWEFDFHDLGTLSLVFS
jgi:2-keto-4-pentenoate hydratase